VLQIGFFWLPFAVFGCCWVLFVAEEYRLAIGGENFWLRMTRMKRMANKGKGNSNILSGK
jgi:hypothetical protein